MLRTKLRIVFDYYHGLDPLKKTLKA
jgi:hypothetical protein